ncbi:retrovirus-related pol polyprotein from transposon TNT 1-94 [Tanacetum coccineum]|uniref:Retrovirus-related pol polyprotein from transposon TNT 1-94 n=1 Tax=Tanacetum coccineum TaxID=301880 RepID=A0ABQ5I7L1_9ASTR
MDSVSKNKLMNEFCAKKGIQREYSIARTPQQNGVAERKNRTLIEAARTMLADSLLPIQFWAEAVHTACYVLNRVLVTKPQMKTPYELLMGKSPNISFMKPFGCPLTILNTMDHLSKFKGKSEEGYLFESEKEESDRLVKQSNSVDFEDVDDQQFIVHEVPLTRETKIYKGESGDDLPKAEFFWKSFDDDNKDTERTR